MKNEKRKHTLFNKVKEVKLTFWLGLEVNTPLHWLLL